MECMLVIMNLMLSLRHILIHLFTILAFLEVVFVLPGTKYQSLCIICSKRPRMEDRSAHLYPPQHSEDDVSYGQNIDLLQTQVVKSKSRDHVLIF